MISATKNGERSLDAFPTESCAHCSEIGAEYACSESGAAFCHEDCLRAHKKMPSIGEELFGNRELLVGYELETGRGGYCASCAKNPIELEAKIVGARVGVCTKKCASDLASEARLQNIEKSAMGKFIHRRRLHRTYRLRAVVRSAIWLWIRSRDDRTRGGSYLEQYRDTMVQVFHVLGETASETVPRGKEGEACRAAFVPQMWDQFASHCRSTVEERWKRDDPSKEFPLGPDYINHLKDALLPFVSFDVDERYVADTLWRMYLVFWRKFCSDSGDCEDLARLVTCDSARDRLKMRSNVIKCYGKLVRIHQLPSREVYFLLRDGLFRDVSPESSELGFEAPISGDELSAQEISGIIGRLKRGIKGARNSLEFGKRYSTSKVSNLTYKAFLLDTCLTPTAAKGLGADFTSFTSQVRANAESGARLVTPLQKEFPTLWKQFIDAFVGVVRNKLERKQFGAKVRSAKSRAAYQKLCSKKGNSPDINTLENAPIQVSKEIVGMYAYYHSFHKEGAKKKDAREGQHFNENQKLVNRDVAVLFDDLAPKMGTDKAYWYLVSFVTVPSSSGEPEESSDGDASGSSSEEGASDSGEN